MSQDGKVLSTKGSWPNFDFGEPRVTLEGCPLISSCVLWCMCEYMLVHTQKTKQKNLTILFSLKVTAITPML